MIALKVKPKGIDQPIQSLQKFLYDQLLVKWNIQPSDYKSYGRAYRNQTADGYSPEVYIGGNEYKDSFFDDTVKALSFFGVDETEKYDKGSTTAKVFLIFMVQIPGLKPSLLHRGDEEVRLDVQSLSTFKRYGFTLTGIETGIDNVFKEYSGWKKTTGIKFRDQHPWHCFRINFSLLYSSTTNINC